MSCKDFNASASIDSEKSFLLRSWLTSSLFGFTLWDAESNNGINCWSLGKVESPVLLLSDILNGRNS